VAESPQMIRYRHTLGAAANNLSLYLSERDDLAGARKLLEQAIEHQAFALKSNPRHPVYPLFLANHYRSLAEVLIRQGEHARAAETAAEAPRLFPDKWQEWIRAASYLANCIPLAEKDLRLSEKERRAVAQSYAKRAVRALSEAVARGCPDLPEHAKSRVFDPLRSREDFAELLRE